MDKETFLKKIQQYQDTPDGCEFPSEGTEYCWSYAHHVDGNKPRYQDMNQICQTCEYWKGARPNNRDTSS